MKRFFVLSAAALVATAVLGGAAVAQNYGPPGGPPPGPPPGYGHPPGPGYGHPPGPGDGYPPGPAYGDAGWHHWHRGDRFNGHRVFIHNWGYYHLPPPPYGYAWVQYPHQFVLIGVNSGIVAQVVVP